MSPRRLDLSKPMKRKESSSSSEENLNKAESSSSTVEESDEEFEIPPGFNVVKGSGSITAESILSEDQELWFFKLPHDLDATALNGVSFRLSKKNTVGEVLTNLFHDGKKYALQNDDVFISNQLVNAFPSASNKKRFVLGKPFAKYYSVVEDRQVQKKKEDLPDENPTLFKKMKH